MKKTLEKAIRELIQQGLEEKSPGLRHYLTIDDLISRMMKIEIQENRNAATLNKMLGALSRKNAVLGIQISCGVKMGHCLTIHSVYEDACLFRCIKCELEYTKDMEKFNERERNLLKAVLQN